MRFRDFFCAAALVALPAAGCDNSLYLLVTTNNVPTGSVSLQIVATRGDASAANQPVLDLGKAPGPSFTFGLQFPADSTGANVTLGVVTRTPDSCLTAVGDATATLGGRETPVTLDLAPVTIKECRQSPPLLLSITPAEAKAGDSIDILGFGFSPKATVSIAGRAVTDLKWLTPARLKATIPMNPTMTGMVDVTITNDNLTQQIRRSDLLTLKP